MAEAIYDDHDEHPVEEYLRASNEGLIRVLPGAILVFLHDEHPLRIDCTAARIVRDLIRFFRSFMPSPALESELALANRELVERLKYIIISSPLLSNPISSQNLSRIAATPRTPNSPFSHQRAQLRARSIDAASAASSSSELSAASLGALRLEIAVGAVIVLALMSGHLTPAIMLAIFVAIARSINAVELTGGRAHSSKPSALALTIATVETLISSSNFWDSLVAEALGILENEEREFTDMPNSQLALRVSLNSTLQTTQGQCDNIRQLFTPLTVPLALGQLSEMYAPAISRQNAPLTLSHRLSHGYLSTRRPQDMASWRRHERRLSSRSHESFSQPRTMANGRATWYAPTATPGSSSLPTSPAMSYHSRRDRQRTRLPHMFLTGRPRTLSEDNGSPPLHEQDEAHAHPDNDAFPPSSTAPHLSRRDFVSPILGRSLSDAAASRPRVRLAVSPSSTTSSNPTSPQLASPPRFSGRAASPNSSRFTTMQSPQRHAHTNSHAQSLPALRHALDAAVASRRFAAAHLLALRFDEADEDDGEFVLIRDDDAYWEDVRSVVSLLGSALEDGGARLLDAIENAVREAQRDTAPSPVPPSPPPTAPPLSPELAPRPLSFAESLRSVFPEATADSRSAFAPSPAPATRFASHLDNATAALDGARALMNACAAALAAQRGLTPPSSDAGGEEDRDKAKEEAEGALELYERMRRELGVALREVERARGPLLALLAPSSPPTAPASALPETSPAPVDTDIPPEPALSSPRSSSGSSSGDGSLESATPEAHDEVSAHLLLTASAAHLPPPGIEQVFEAASTPLSPAPPPRARSLLSREERIARAKARRATGSAASGGMDKRASLLFALGLEAANGDADPSMTQGGWGPGGEVVQELKDAIWQVGERRKRLQQLTPAADGPVVRDYGARRILERWQPSDDPDPVPS